MIRNVSLETGVPPTLVVNWGSDGGWVAVRVIDVAGRCARVVWDAEMAGGTNEVHWDGTGNSVRRAVIATDVLIAHPLGLAQSWTNRRALGVLRD